MLGAAAVLGMAPLLGGCARGADNGGPLVAMEYETWFTCAVGAEPDVAAVQEQSAQKLAAVRIAAGKGGGVNSNSPNLALSLAEAAQARQDIEGNCAIRSAMGWGGREATPILGTYESSDPAVIRQHAAWFSGAGIDFLLIDWSNNLGGNWSNGVGLGIMAATYSMAQTYTKLSRRPRFALLLGLDNGHADTAHFQTQVDMVYQLFIQSPTLRPLYQNFLGKPLLGVFTGPRFTAPPTWSDPRFTVRWVNGFNETTHGNLMGYWSWIDRVPQITYREEAGPHGTQRVAEAVTVAAAYPGQSSWTPIGARNHGQTYLDQWKVAFAARPEVVFLCQWNEFAQPDQYSVSDSNDMEPTALHGYGVHGDGGWGTYYLDLTRTMVEAFKAGRPQPHVPLDLAMP